MVARKLVQHVRRPGFDLKQSLPSPHPPNLIVLSQKNKAATRAKNGHLVISIIFLPVINYSDQKQLREDSFWLTVPEG